MSAAAFVTTNDLRAAFSAALSTMYRQEVPAYGTLLELVADINAATLNKRPGLRSSFEATETLDRISQERHGAIRLGTGAELAMMRRIFAVMGMFPVGYYDLSAAGVPVHSTAFRPVDQASLKFNPFRVFTSLLRLDLIADPELRASAEIVLAARKIFTEAAIALLEKAERDGGLSRSDGEMFIAEVLNTFRWHRTASVDKSLYDRLHSAHRLIADVVSFRGPHINHLTPRTLDIDAAQDAMPRRGMQPKAVVEGPPSRACPILLRQTSFKAIEERVSFPDAEGRQTIGSHTARFGEIEQRGIALTPKGRALYDRLLNESRAKVRPQADGSNAEDYRAALRDSFAAFPDDWNDMRRAGLGYFQYSVCPGVNVARLHEQDIEALVAAGAVRCDPIVYEDFLPVSAAGIFQSNLGDGAVQDIGASPNQKLFEQALGGEVRNEFAHYAAIESASINGCLAALAAASPAAAE